MSAIEKIEKRVLALPLKDRILLVESLLGSLPPLPDSMSEAEEIAEAERRDMQIESREVQPLDEDEFWRRMDADLPR